MNSHHYTVPPGRFSAAATHDLRVFPVPHRSKKPGLQWKRYQSEAPTAEDLLSWDDTDCNVAVVTGTPGGVVVLDVDSDEAQQVVDKLDLPDTPTVLTARGRHLYFRTPAQEIRNSVNVTGVKLDVRGFGGYVIGAGSMHPDGSVYRWEKSPAEVDFAPIPERLLALLQTKKPTQRRARATNAPASNPSCGHEGLGSYLARELDEAVSLLGASSEGERNDTLFKMAARMARHVSAADVSWSTYSEALSKAAFAIGLGEDETARTIESGWKKGCSEPTPWVRTAAEHVYLGYQERFYHVASGRDLRPAGFNGQYGHQYFGRGTFANFLLQSNYIRKVHDVTYEPLTAERFIERHGLEYLNTYRPSTVSAVEGDPSPFEDFLVGLVPDAEERDHLVKMIAFTVRNPGKKLRYAVMLRSGEQGVGKSMLADIWGGLLGAHNVRKATPQEIASDYQGYLPQTLLVLVEEMNLGAGLKTYNAIKDMITGDTFTVNEKHLRQRQWPIYASFVFFSNLEQPILLEANDRRIYYIDSPAKPRGDQFYLKFAAWWAANLGVIRAYVDSIDLEGFNPHKPPPTTEAKLALIAGSKSELARDLQWSIQVREGCFDRDLVTLNQVYFEFDRKWPKHKLAKALKEVGAECMGQQRVGADRTSLWAVRHTKYWRFADPSTRADEYSSVDGGLFAGLDGTDIEVVHLSFLPAPDQEQVEAR